MVRQSRTVTVIDGNEVIEVMRENADGEPAGRVYYVQGQKFETLKEATRAARKT